MSIQRDLDTRKNLKVVTSNDFFKACGLENTTLKARKLLYLAISQCRLNDEHFYEYKITVKQFAELMDIDSSNVFKEADAITDELMKGFIKYVPEGKKRFKKFHLFERCEYNEHSEIVFELHREMTPICLSLKKNFSQPLLSDFMQMRSNYSIILFHYFFSKMKNLPGTRRIEFDCSIDELRNITGCTNKFLQIGQFKEKVLDRALNEILLNCDTKITYTNLKNGRSVIGFHFVAINKFDVDLTDFVPNEETLKRINDFKKKQQNIS